MRLSIPVEHHVHGNALQHRPVCHDIAQPERARLVRHVDFGQHVLARLSEGMHVRQHLLRAGTGKCAGRRRALLRLSGAAVSEQEDRLIDIEMRLMHQEKLLEQLNEVVTDQHKLIEALRREIARLKELVDTDDWAKPQLLLVVCGFACTSALLMVKLKEAGLQPSQAKMTLEA